MNTHQTEVVEEACETSSQNAENSIVKKSSKLDSTHYNQIIETAETKKSSIMKRFAESCQTLIKLKPSTNENQLYLLCPVEMPNCKFNNNRHPFSCRLQEDWFEALNKALSPS
ncbi:hypothetical protein HNY73_001737 [Argiope bruennichi]|uniref:Uncharacterized protein n=1 Tax=Argiope bruennichi TaxID=94029 RepID=A0A8T0FR96_ARGBR|nr:hypothetical protein HNY73_001737 [Argiope bruennichi]